MKLRVGLGLFFLFSTNLAFAGSAPTWAQKSGWVKYEDICEYMNESEGRSTDCGESMLVTQNAAFPHWAGEIVSMYFSTSYGGFSNTKVKVTWTTDKSPYDCGTVIKLKEGEMKDFTHRSIAMKKCR